MGHVIDEIKPIESLFKAVFKIDKLQSYLSVYGEWGSVTTMTDSILSQTKVNLRESLEF